MKGLILLANLCDSITGDNGGSNEQSIITPFHSSNQFPWLTRQDLSKAEMQGFLDVAKKVGSKFAHCHPTIYVCKLEFILLVAHSDAFCKASYEGQTPRAIVESLGVTDAIEIQQLTDFLKRFGGIIIQFICMHQTTYLLSPHLLLLQPICVIM